MLDLTGLPALDLALGLAFIYLLLSLLASTIQEFIASFLGLRARTLEQGLRSLLEDPKEGWEQVDKFYDHELIRALYRTPPPEFRAAVRSETSETPDADAQRRHEPGKNAKVAKRGPIRRAFGFFKRTKGPSYISPRSFALVVLDNIAPDADTVTIADKAEKALKELPPGLAERLKPLVTGPAQDIEGVRTNLEAWYDDTMARVSGWYKRKTQVILIVLGIVLVPAINADSIKMAERMWKDDTVRAAVVAQAQAKASADQGSSTLGSAADGVDGVAKVGIPIGWRGPAVPEDWNAVPLSVAGWLITILAISLGAPFWFDALSRVARLRSSGKPETPLPASGSGKANERVLTPPQVPSVVVQTEKGE